MLLQKIRFVAPGWANTFFGRWAGGLFPASERPATGHWAGSLFETGVGWGALKALRPADERVRREVRRALHLANARIDARAQNLGDPSTAPCAGANADQLAPSAAECWACKRRAAPLLRTSVPKCPSAPKDCRERGPPPAPCAWPPAAPDLVEKSTNRDRRSAGVGRRFDLSRSFPRERVVPGVPQGACASSLRSEGQAS